MRAVELFYRAISRGVDAARINLAHALGYIERGDEVIPELLKVRREQLSTYDKVLFYRVKSLHEETSGDLLTALSDAETAWDLAQNSAHFSILAPDILSQLAVLNSRVGRAQTALFYIEKNLSISTGFDALRAQIHRAHILITLGRFSDALSELEKVDLRIAPRYLVSIVHVYLGEAEWALGNTNSSISHFEAAVSVAAELNIGFEEFLARVGLALLYGISDKLDLAFEHLGQAEHLVGDRSDRLYFRFREILLSRMRGSLGATEAIGHLKTVSDELGKMGALQEQGWVRLHVAHELWRLGSPDFKAELQVVHNLAQILQNPAFLSRELVLLPVNFREIVGSHDTAPVRLPDTLRVHSLGREALLLNGKPVHLTLKRGVELLVYFIESSNVSFGRLLEELFSDEKPRTAKSYFHQFRHQLKNQIPGVNVVYDSAERTYRLESDIAIQWDVSEYRRSPAPAEPGKFLPNSNSKWAREFEMRLRSEHNNLQAR